MFNTHIAGFPYSNFHQLNLDWILSTIKDLSKNYDNLRDTVNNFISQFDDNLTGTVKTILLSWVDDGTLNNLLTQISQSVINAVICGIDNTGGKDVGEDITNLLSNFTGRKIYFPAGTYKINTSVTMRTDDIYRGNMIICDADAKFTTDGVTTMFILGNGNAASTLEKFGFDGGYIDCKNVSECGIKINNNQYSCIINNVLMRNCGDITAVLLGDDTTTSSQAYITNLTITGDGSVRGIGLQINSTDNYLCNINIGRMKHNIIFAGGGNLGVNIHTWNYGDEYQNLGISSVDEKLTYDSIRINGSNNFSNIQVDNGTPAITFTRNAINNTIDGCTFNYENNFPWGSTNDDCRCISVLGQQSTYGNTFHVNGIVFSPKSNSISLIKFFLYDRNTVFPYGHSWSAPYNADRGNILKTKECDFARTIYKTTPCLSTYITVSDTSKCCLLGYIGMNLTPMNAFYNFSDNLGGNVDVHIKNNNGTITVTSKINNNFADNTTILIGNSTTVINDFTVVPVYYKAETSGARYSSCLITPVLPVDIFNSFVPMKTPEWINVPSNVISVDCYQ